MKPTARAEFWSSQVDHLLLNPRLPDEQKKIYEDAWVRERGRRGGEGHPRSGLVLLATSGSTGVSRLVLLGKEQLLASAAAVNQHIQSDSNDVWLKTLPEFHVGGLGIFARAFLSGASVVDTAEVGPLVWNPRDFVLAADFSGATITSLVPAQIYDIVRAGLHAPGRLRVAFAGGGALNPALYREARQLGWPILPSYGMTECSSQVGTASLRTLENTDLSRMPPLELLPHIEAKVTNLGRLALKSPALLQGYLWITDSGSRFEDPKKDGWYVTKDKAELHGRELTMLGRLGDFLKIGGESVDFTKLQSLFEDIRTEITLTITLPDMALCPVADERLGSSIQLLVQGRGGLTPPIQRVIDDYNAAVAPYERIRQTHIVDRIPRSPLGKLLRPEAEALVLSLMT